MERGAANRVNISRTEQGNSSAAQLIPYNKYEYMCGTLELPYSSSSANPGLRVNPYVELYAERCAKQTDAWLRKKKRSVYSAWTSFIWGVG